MKNRLLFFIILSILLSFFYISLSSAVEDKLDYSISNNKIKLSWKRFITTETHYVIQRKTINTEFSDLTTLNNYSSYYYDVSADNGYIYSYRVCTKNSNGSIINVSNTITVPYLFPVNISTSAKSDNQITVDWEYPISTYYDSSKIESILERKSSVDSTWKQVIVTNNNYFIDTNVQEGIAYSYRIKTKYSNKDTLVYYPSSGTTYCYTLLNSPTDFSFKINNLGQIALSWEDNSLKESNYYVEKVYDLGTKTIKLNSNEEKYTDTELINGNTYVYRIYCENSKTRSSFSKIIKIYYFYPEDLECTAVSSNEILLSWTLPYGVKDIPFKTIIERRNNSAIWEEIALVDSYITSYSDANLEENSSYYYRISFLINNDYKLKYIPSDSVGKHAITYVNTPTGFYGFAETSNSIHLEWDIIDEKYRYVLEKKIGDDIFTPIVSNYPNNFYIDYSVSPQGTYTYRLKTFFGNKYSLYTNEINVSAEYVLPPKSLKSTLFNDNRILISWEDTGVFESNYEIWRRVNNGFWELFSIVDKNSKEFIDYDIQSEMTYSYKIRTIKNDSIFSEFTDVESIYVNYPNKPLQLSYKFDKSKKMFLSWIDNSTIETGYVIEYKTNINDVWKQLYTLTPNTQYKKIYTLNKGFLYHFRVLCMNDTNSTYSSSDVLSVFYDRPSTPSSLSIKNTSSGKVELSWIDNCEYEDGFYIYRSLDNIEWKSIAKCEKNQTFFIDTTVSPDMSYYYKIASFNTYGYSEYSNTVQVLTKEECFFNDLEGYEWAENNISLLSRLGALPEDFCINFKPEKKITKGEFVYILCNYFNLLNPSYAGSLKDVDISSKYYKEIISCY